MTVNELLKREMNGLLEDTKHAEEWTHSDSKDIGRAYKWYAMAKMHLMQDLMNCGDVKITSVDWKDLEKIHDRLMEL